MRCRDVLVLWLRAEAIPSQFGPADPLSMYGGYRLHDNLLD